ncbi:P-loop containing nucleoside triphosphate hydrolase protein [Pluteus cervinus]|uniref:P-loop containing nucleoside triphosphate hydrolase protein n=1 Tax=Pluteus cervinus TaxID=181527 RepID=A0ACD3A9C4_9AGAR|nr:P-loop containing nucleoside triphosphate hydrolase protein [Pluteus cervinus]
MHSIADDLPMIYYATYSILNPSKFSIASIATLQQSSALIRGSFDYMQWLVQRFRSHILEVKRLYALEQIEPTVKEGVLPYPPQESEKPRGMSFDLKDVSFSYPTTKTKEPALKDISCSIKSGQMVVIVGANGSGKSTLIKLLNRLYDPTSGTIMVDGNEISSYRLEDYRSSVATLTQDHTIFGINIGENIGLGHTDRVDDEALIMKAAGQGGATEVIKKFKDGLATSLRPYNSAYGVHVSEYEDTPLGRALKKMEKTVTVSGGEKQRIVASRTFMRFESGRITFVAVDEPSSAMDPEAEFQLFKNLRSWRDGKTMIFVTHRFGHLTKHADLILCMKEGTLVESGTHEQLMTLAGEYSKLYKIQAEAFEAPVPEPAKIDDSAI